MKFEEDFTVLRYLEPGDIFETKAGTELMYLENLDDDKHLLKHIGDDKEFEVPHGGFPVFKAVK